MLQPKRQMSVEEKLWWARCIEANRYRYNFGRQANRSLAGIEIPNRAPSWVLEAKVPSFRSQTALPLDTFPLDTKRWQPFKLAEIFHLQRGQRFVQRDLAPGTTPYIRASALNNGVSSWINMEPMFPAGSITVSSNGSVGEVFYQPLPFVASDDIVVLTSKTPMSAYAGLFFSTVLHAEKYRFNYGRKWFTNRMADHEVRLPANKEGNPDWGYADRYINSFTLAEAIAERP
ncbi:restriction endonuclease subunit S [Amycolatopsis japonica]|uniref:restriction endonuclease subunit S n=1 Tax=Amycolatopsis japonica TaxID=208439 RepID=UPI0033DF57D0